MNRQEIKLQYPAPLVIEFIRYFGLLLSKILWRIKYHGIENIPQDLEKGLLVVANHQSYFDPFWICLPIHRKFRFMAWDKAFDWFLVGRIIKYLGSFPVSLERGGTRQAMVESLSSLRDGATLIIFPEGSREFSDGKFLPFKTGSVRIAMEANVPILPVTIRGANNVWSQDIKFPRPRNVDLYYHPLFEVPPPKVGQDVHELAKETTERLRAIIEQTN